ncbi:hypothetical protein NDU88_005993 [Pleurodeles waltl]|uniref:Uncharacterized protein n=1 Tax=Pleurodeles waltl TaxID=8319 RepID=A0AAV7WZB0_PLEWA|nr:hypothetical protein NDU88_005993 [Pleurodeles waltl]
MRVNIQHRRNRLDEDAEMRCAAPLRHSCPRHVKEGPGDTSLRTAPWALAGPGPAGLRPPAALGAGLRPVHVG